MHRNTFAVKSVLSRLAQQISAVTAPRRWLSPRLWVLVLGVFFLAQFGLLAHQASHHLRPDIITATDDCVLCQVSAGIIAGPAAPLLVLPVFVLLAIVVTPAAPALRPLQARRPFQSRAPPLSTRI